jgi:formylglycine-generating enzyme
VFHRVVVLVGLATVLMLAGGIAHADVLNMPSGQTSLETVFVGNPGNGSDPSTGIGKVDYVYRMSKYDVTNAQYCQFLNARLPTISDPATTANAEGVLPGDAYGLYNVLMMTGAMSDTGGINYDPAGPTGAKFSVRSGRDNWPVTYVSWYDTLRFANWLQNGQGNSDTESGTYTIADGIPNAGVVTIPDAATRAGWTTPHWVLPTDAEWYKTAYHKNDGATANYWLYPTQSNTAPSNVLSPTGTNNANYYVTGYTDPVNYLTPVGAFAASPGTYGTFDQGGDFSQWDETWISIFRQGFGPEVRGGSWADYDVHLVATGFQYNELSGFEEPTIGFRLAVVGVPEPGTMMLLLAVAVSRVAYCWRRCGAR